jgi:hypothetical protein
MRFTPSTNFISSNSFVANKEEIKNEPMIYGGSWDWCLDNAGPLTRGIMDTIEADMLNQSLRHTAMGYHPVIDTKSVMLMPGHYPCIPGWHCDGVIRKDRSAQPDLTTLAEDVQHYICCIADNKNTQCTEIMHDPIDIPDEQINENAVWASVDEYVNEHTRHSFMLQSGQIARISRSTLHRGPQATVRGWRYFFRLSFYHMPVKNQIRNQVQVYADPALGW